MTLRHHAPECPKCHQRSIVRTNFNEWECVNCDFQAPATQPESHASVNPLFGLLWLVGSAATIVSLLGGVPELPFRVVFDRRMDSGMNTSLRDDLSSLEGTSRIAPEADDAIAQNLDR